MYALVSMYMRRMRRIYQTYTSGSQASRWLVHALQYLIARVVNEDINAGRRVVLACQRLQVCCLKGLRVFTPLSCYYIYSFNMS